MSLSVFDLFKIGIGPSSSHTVGPMIAAYRFATQVTQQCLENTATITVDLFGSLAMTGIGHDTDKAILLGLSGETPEAVEIEQVIKLIQQINTSGHINILGQKKISFNVAQDLRFNRGASLPQHANGLVFNALDERKNNLLQRTFFSVGGGFVLSEKEISQPQDTQSQVPQPYIFSSADQLLAIGKRERLSIAEIALANETINKDRQDVIDKLNAIWLVMDQCISRGCQTDGELPGQLQVKRRAAKLYRELSQKENDIAQDTLSVLDWVSVFALAVNEENAAGGRIVTAPTNGAAGVIPAVLAYYLHFVLGKCNEQERKLMVARFLLTASAIGMLFKSNASISAAEVGCQGEIGVACSMAAAGLTAVMGGTNAQIENAAEIGMEHNLGLTCDPVEGLVQIPCIERNTMGAVKAINASRLALQGDGQHRVSLDSVIETMRQTGKDMQDKYKETSLGGLAVNVVNC